MEHQFKINPKKLRKIKLATTLGVWVIATGMLAFCIPFVTVTESGVILPLAVILGAAVATVAIWRRYDRHTINSVALANNVKDLEQRVANLEVICSNEELNFQDKLKQLESKD